MESHAAVSLLVITAAAVLAPLLSELLRRFRIPVVLFELILGIIVGPAVLGWAEVTPLIAGLAELGLCLLFFLAGYELDFSRIRGAPLNRGIVGWCVTLGIGLAVGALLASQGFVISSLLIGLALTTTALGTLLPMLSDRGLLETRFGAFLIAAGAVGEFGPVLAVTLLLGTTQPLGEAALLVLFVAIAVGVAWVAARPQPPRLIEMLRRHLETSSQLPVRILMLLVVGMVALASVLGLDVLLGAFAAGLIARLAIRPEQVAELKPRVEAIGFGFFIPLFFVVSGMKFDLSSLLSSPSNLVRLAVFAALLLLVRGVPALFVYRGVLSASERTSLMFLQATALPLLVVITQIGVQTQQMRPENATALVGAGMLSVLVFPLVGFAILDRSRRDVPLDDVPLDDGPVSDERPASGSGTAGA
ncbi:MAG: cation:proton antiporter [Microthrixaceae bacterium]